jgi:hypothetical protein
MEAIKPFPEIRGTHMTAELQTDRRGLLLAAAPMLADRLDVLSVTASQIAREMGVSEEDFIDEFGGVEGYCALLQLQFFEGRLNNVLGRAGIMQPGVERIRTAWTSYLDYSVEHAAVHGWCRRARQRFPSLLEELRRRNHAVLLMIQIEFSTLRCPHAMERARLAVGMVLETVKVETESRAKNEAMRALLWSALEMFART